MEIFMNVAQGCTERRTGFESRRMVIAVALVLSPLCLAQQQTGVSPADTSAVVKKAAEFLGKRQSADGSFSSRASGPGITALIAAGLIRNGATVNDPVVTKSLAYLEKYVQPDGGIYDRMLANYTTCVALLTLREANTGGRYDAAIRNAGQFLKTLQYDESRVEGSDVRYGGAGYDGKSRPDLSNTQFFVDALIAAGVPKDDPAVKRALAFASRCQNLPGETNDQPFAKKATEDDKGGFVYNPVMNEKEAAKAAEEGLRSAGTMTYAGLKSFLHAGVSKDDPRVKGAIGRIRTHYTLDDNPGQGQRGLFYYYHTFGKAMDALGDDEFTDAAGKKHDWRKELFEALKKRQRPDGSWINDKSEAFLEDNPDLATAYALLALSYCQAAKK
jgi:Squalene-hopene cyclase C-terminal domain/Prenyltransferase and squalene oxidase repeat